jgi:hypothetical protein
MKTAKKIMLMDGAKVSHTHGQYGKRVAEITFKGGDSITVTASFTTLLDAKVKVAIKEYYSNVIAGLAKTAREINESARRNRMKAA